MILQGFFRGQVARVVGITLLLGLALTGRLNAQGVTSVMRRK
jgi:hypothetical protein